jgi:hypothetical protein
MYAGVTLRRTNAPGPLSDASIEASATIERSAARIAAPVKAAVDDIRRASALPFTPRLAFTPRN